MVDRYEILKVIAYQFYNQKLVEELVDIKNKDLIEVFLKDNISKSIFNLGSVFEMSFKEQKDELDKKYNLEFIFEFLKYWEEKYNIIKLYGQNSHKSVSYYLSLLDNINCGDSLLFFKRKIGHESDICFSLKGDISVQELFDRCENSTLLEFFTKYIDSERKQLNYYNPENLRMGYRPNYIFIVRLIKALGYEYACESMENYFNGVDERGPIEKLLQEHTFEEIRKIMGFEHLQEGEFLEKMWELGSTLDTSTERRKFASDLVNLLNKIREYYLEEDKDPYLLKGYKDEVYHREDYGELFEEYCHNLPKFEDDVLAEISDAERYLIVIWHKSFLPRDIAGKYHSRLVKDYKERTGATDF